MPYYKDINILLIHIPKTGGSSLENYLQTKSTQTLFSSYTNNIMPTDSLQKISLQHQVLHSIWKYRKILNVDFNNIKILTIVRNPYDRIISDLFYFNLIKKDTPADKVHDIIKKYITRTDLDNHNIPQYKFICDAKGNINTYIKQIKIFKTETLTKELQKYGFTDYKGKDCSSHYMNYLNQDSINLINKVYRIDFLIFDYIMV
jgi:hypothetical protein